MELVVARIGGSRGVKGEVHLDIRTDRPAERLTVGTRFTTDRVDTGHLTLAAVRHDAKGWFARFTELPDRDAAEAARGALLFADPDPGEPDAWYPHELRGLAVELPDGTPVGAIAGVISGPAQDLLEVREVDGAVALVPFVRALVPVVDVEAGRVVVDPPAGLLAVRPAGPDDADDAAPRPGDQP
ncbi:MAG: ribosome maturation factor RimM [Bifidobacteriaceae bacterium]|nr:ribosome maturation factor RimM [Bifidobacteriaceae bacterium]